MYQLITFSPKIRFLCCVANSKPKHLAQAFYIILQSSLHFFVYARFLRCVANSKPKYLAQAFYIIFEPYLVIIICILAYFILLCQEFSFDKIRHKLLSASFSYLCFLSLILFPSSGGSIPKFAFIG